MPSSNSEARARVALLALMTLPAWACATAIDNALPDATPLANHDASGAPNAGSAASAAGSVSAGKSGAPGSAGSGSSGSGQSGGSPSSAGKGGTGGTASVASAGKGGTGNAGAGSGSAGKGGTSSGGTGSGSAGKAGASSAGSSSAGSSSAGTSSAGSTSGGATGGGTCDAAHAVATLMTSQVYTGKANDCVRVAVNPTWSTIALQFQPQPGTTGYPVPFTFESCGGNGTGSLTADYANTTFKSGTNPGCDFFVQFGGGATTIKVTYYD
jgi:hypothetical protein